MNVLSKLTAKGRIAAVLALGFATLFSGCKEEDPPAVSVDQPIMSLNMSEQTRDLKVISNTDWAATIDYGATAGQTDWITMSRTTGRGTMELTLHIEECKTDLMDGRRATITFKTTGSNPSIATAQIRQSHSEATLVLEPNFVEVGSNATNAYFMIQSNTRWEFFVGTSTWARVTSPAADASGKISGEGNTLVTIAVDENTAHGQDREFNFVVFAKDPINPLSEVFTLLQRDQPDPTLILGQEKLYFEAIVDASNETLSVPVITNTSNDPIPSSNATWCEAVYNSTTKTIDVTVTSNTESTEQRECIVTVIAYVDNEPVTKQIQVFQAGSTDPSIVVTRQVVTIPDRDLAVADGKVSFSVGFYTVPVGLNVSLTPDQPEWIESAALNAGGDGVDIVALPNLTKEIRQTTLTLYATSAGKTVSAIVTVIQNPAGDMNMSVSPTAINALQAGEAMDILILSDQPGVSFNCSSNKSWVTLSAPVDAGLAGFAGTAMKVTATIAANADWDSRDATITVTGAVGQQQQVLAVNVNQAGTGTPQAVLVRNTITVPKTAGSYKVGISDTEGTVITCSSTAPWITGATFNSTDKTIDFSVTLNDVSAANRTGAVIMQVVKGGRTQVIELEVIQLGTGAAELLFGEQDIEVEAVGGAVSLNVVALNGSDWSVISATPVTGFYSVAPAKGTDVLTFEVGANATTAPRNGKIQILATNGDSRTLYTITVNQKGVEGPNVMPIATTVYLGAAATAAGSEPGVLLLNTDATVTLSVSTISNSAMFAAGTVIDTGSYPAVLKLALTANESLQERTGSVTVVANRGGQNQIIEITVIQAAADAPQLIFPDMTYAYGVAALTGTRVVFLNPNGAQVAIISSPSWITPVTTTPAVQSYIEFNVAANDTSVANDGYIVIEATIGTNKAQYTIFVTQAGLAPIGASLATANIAVAWDVVTPTAAAEKIVVNDLPTDAVVKANSSASWLTVGTPDTTIPQSTIELTTTTINPYVTPRNATVTIVVTRGTEQQTLTATVVQEGAPGPVAYLITDRVEVAPDPGAGTYPYVMSPVTFLNYNSNVIYGTPNIDASWLTATVAGNAIEPEIADANTGSATRTGTITVPVTAGGQTSTVTLTVVQYGLGSPALTMSATSLVFGPAAQPAVSYYFNNDSGAAVSVLSAPAWFSTTDVTNINDGVYIFNVDENTSVYERTGTIVFKAEQGGQSAIYSVAVAQNGFMPLAASISPATAIVDASTVGAIDDVVKLFNIPATTNVTATSNKTWLTIPTQPTAPAWTFTPEVTANTTGSMRSGTITVEITRGTGVTQEVAVLTVTVTQLALDLPVPAAYLDMSQVNFDAVLPAATPEKTVTINNVEAAYTYFVTKPDWVTVVAPAAGSPTTTFTVVPTGDNTGAQREGNVTIRVNNGNKSQELTLRVVQAAAAETPTPNVVFENNQIDFGNASDNATVNVYNFDTAYGVSWTAPSWVTVTDDLANGDFEVAVPANTGIARSGLVQATFTNGNKTQVVELRITQEGAAAPVAPAVSFANNLVEFVYDPAAATAVVVNGVSAVLTEVVGNGIEWSYPAWITVGSSGFASGSIALTAATNDTGVARTGTVTAVVKGDDGGSKVLTINVVQAAEPKAGTPNISFQKADVQFVLAGTAQSVDLNGWDAAYDYALSVPSWITPSFAAGSLTLTADANTGAARSGVVTIYVTNDNSDVAVATLQVAQEGVPVPVAPTITLAHSSIQFAADATAAINVAITNYDASATGLTYTASVNSDDFTATVSSGVVVITPVAANATTSAKTATVAVTVKNADGLTATANIAVTQFGLSAVGVVFPTGPVQLTYQAMTAYSVPIVNPNNATIAITGASGAMFGAFSGSSVAVTENTTNSERSGTLTVTATLNGVTESATIPYVQEPKSPAAVFNPAIVGLSSTTIPQAISSHTIYLNGVPTGATTTVAGELGFLTTVSVTGNTVITVTASNNGTGVVRLTTVMIKVEYNGNYVYLPFTIYQLDS